MEEKQSRAHLKRSSPEDDDSNKPPAPKRVRFPKGKKVKPGDQVGDVQLQHAEDSPSDVTDARSAAKERAMRRNQIAAELFSEENRGMLHDISGAEVHYEDSETFVDDGIQIEPFNLSKEREEGYFDAEGNFVEYVNENEIKDAWLDSVDVEPKFTGKGPKVTNNEDDIEDLTSQEIGKMKRRIADVLEPGETVLQALRRLKGTSNRKEKMSPETKVLFDQLTEDAMKLMENDVYDETKEVFQREAEGYERLVQARGEGTSVSSNQDKTDSTVVKDPSSNGSDSGGASILLDIPVGSSNLNIPTAEISTADDFDMFGEDDENADANPTSESSNLVTNANGISHPSEGADLQSDYAYDESSGYYYSSSLGYYYDPSSGFYCYAASGQWYSYDEQNGTYVEVQEAASNAS